MKNDKFLKTLIAFISRNIVEQPLKLNDIRGKKINKTVSIY